MNIKIYTLEDPQSFDIKYVGITSSSLKERLQGHLKEVKYNTRNKLSGKQRWIKSLLDINLKPIITEIETITNTTFSFVEQFIEPGWIWQFKSWGYELLNIKDLVFDFGVLPEAARYKTPITQYSLNGNFIRRFESVSAATQTINGDGSIIQRAAKLQNGYKAYGFQWRYDRHACDTVSKAKSKNLPNTSKAVLQFKNGILIKEWASGQIAAKSLGLLKSKISNCCNGKRKTHGGYTWEFKNK